MARDRGTIQVHRRSRLAGFHVAARQRRLKERRSRKLRDERVQRRNRLAGTAGIHERERTLERRPLLDDVRRIRATVLRRSRRGRR